MIKIQIKYIKKQYKFNINTYSPQIHKYKYIKIIKKNI